MEKHSSRRYSTLTVVSAHYQRGWGAYDHRLDDSELGELVGRQFAGLARARQAADAIARRSRCGGCYVALEYELKGQRYIDATRASGSTIQRSPREVSCEA